MIRRLQSLTLVCLAAFAVICLRLVHLQLIQGSHYRHLAERNRMRVIPEPPPRGLILDRGGRILAGGQQVFQVAVVPQEAEDLDRLLAELSLLLDRPVAELTRRFRRERSLVFMPAAVVPRVSRSIALRLEEERWRLPGLVVRPVAARRYPYGEAGAHLLGYLSQPTEEDLPRLKQFGFRATYLIGRTGLERAMDDVLRGEPGGSVVEVDHRARQVRVVTQRAPKPGQSVTLTFDAGLASLVHAAFGEQPGACAIVDPSNGAVLATASVPSFDPEAFAVSDSDRIRVYLDDPRSPLLDRSLWGRYTPGSIAKVLTAGAALERGIVDPRTILSCAGKVRIGDRDIHCWNRDGHGPLTLPDALMVSCNAYFIQVGRRLGLGPLLEAFTRGGLGAAPAWTLGGASGHLPERRMTEGEVAMLAMGQGEILVTPMQMAMVASAIANGGTVFAPWVIDSIDGRPAARPGPAGRLGWTPQTLDAVRAGMQAAVASTSGTGHRAVSPHVSIAGKTGTAQTHRPDETHGWFIGYCPADEPRAALAVVAEFGGSGGDLPSEVARTVCEYLMAAHAPARAGGAPPERIDAPAGQAP
ncbi:MAG TPA: penicillin-binding protein 2 [bacterium]